MQFKLFVCNDSDNVINKALSGEQVLTITLKRDFNIYSPEIILRGDSILNIEAFNYAEIPDLNRKYFIRSVESVGYDLWRLSLETDVLETYKAEILSSDSLVNKAIESGDYGETRLNYTGEVEVGNFVSDVELENFDNSILTVLRWQ